MKFFLLITNRKFPSSCLVLILSFLFVSNTLPQERIVSIQPLSNTKSSNVFTPDNRQISARTRLLQVSNSQEILQEPPSRISVQLEDILPTEDITLPNSISLESFDILSSDAKLVAGTERGDKLIDIQIITYKGWLEGDGWINLSFSKTGVMGLMRTRNKTFVIQPVHTYALETDRSKHIIYEMSDTLSTGNWCGVDTEVIPPHLKKFMSNLDIVSARKSTSSRLTVKLALETDYETYVSFENDSLLTTAYLLSIAASVSQIYEQEMDIKLEVAYSRVWTTPEDPYTALGYSLLPELRDYWNANMQHIERDVAMLIIKAGNRLSGGMAYLDALCKKDLAYAISGESIGTVAHELGHTFGALHTHNCSWPAGPNGTLAPIDQCASVEGDCLIDEIVPQEGTIMSYCPTRREVFHPLVRNFIRARADANPCIGDGTELVNTVEGIVTWNGLGLANVIIKADRYDGEIVSSTTDANGSYSLNLFNDTYYLTADRDSFLIIPTGFSSKSIPVFVVGEETEVVNFEASELLSDQYEPDNSLGEARQILTDGNFQQHTLHIPNDKDFIKFQAEAGQTYILLMQSDQDILIPDFELLDTDGTTLLAQGGYTPYIEWKVDKTGTYFIRIYGYNAKGFYGISVSPIPFTKVETEIFPLKYSNADWGDYDEDGDFDLLVAGTDANGNYKMGSFRNDDGDLIETQVGIGPLPAYAYSRTSLDWGDFDNDRDLDALVGGSDYANIYINDGGEFHSIGTIDESLRTVQDAAWGDYDNDGDLDVLIQSLTDIQTKGDYPLIRLYRNEESSFLDTELRLRGVDFGRTKWGDYDGDGDLDIIVAGSSNQNGDIGSTSANGFFTKIYRNEDNSFVDANIEIDQVAFSPDFALGDFDGDGDLDLALAGMTDSKLISQIYRYDNGKYTNINADLTGVHNASLAWGDCDNDGDLDLVVTGMSSVGARSVLSTKLYINSGETFQESPNSLILPDIGGVVKMCDYDNDRDLDLLLVGSEHSWSVVSNFLRNETIIENLPPNAPKGLVETTANGSVTLFWNPSQDDKTPSKGLTYNVRIGTTPGGMDVLSPMSDVVSGTRHIVDIGNAGHLSQRTIHNLDTNKYYWSVQAIDNNFAGSAWALEQSFELHYPADTISSVKLPGYPRLSIYPNPAEDLVTIKCDRIDNFYFEIASVNGRIIEDSDFTGRFQQIDLSSFQKGVYFITIRSKDFVTTRKIIKL